MGEFIDLRPEKIHKHLQLYEVNVAFWAEVFDRVKVCVQYSANTHTFVTEGETKDGRVYGTWRYIARGANRDDITRRLQGAEFGVTIGRLDRGQPDLVYVASRGGSERRCGCGSEVAWNRCKVRDENLPSGAFKVEIRPTRESVPVELPA